MRPLHVGARRLFATAALLLASSLEICGCNPARDCQSLQSLRLSSLVWQTLFERCSECLTAHQLNTLKQVYERLPVAVSAAQFPSGETVGQALDEKDSPSFYDAASASSPQAAASGVYDFTSLESSAHLGHITPSEVKFAPWSIPESVLFLYQKTESPGEREPTPIATAFVLSVPGRNHRTLSRFLVTARHVLDPAWAHCADRDPTSIEVRLNRRNGGVGYETLSLISEHGPRYVTPQDSTADVAIIRLDRNLIPNLDAYKFVDTPFRLLPTPSELHYISSRQRDDSRNLSGQPVTTANLRTQVPAGFSAFPLSQSGTLSSTRDEPVSIQCGGKPVARPLRVWFIDASIERGVSGAPVYTSLLREGETSPSPILLGVQAIAWPDRGVAGVTPAAALASLVEDALAARPARHASAQPGTTTLAQTDPQAFAPINAPADTQAQMSAPGSLHRYDRAEGHP